MKTKIRKAIIPTAGLGTRFLPVTKTVPKEMLPIIETPSILLIVEEAVRAGIEDIVLITGRNKTAIEDFFDRSYELEDTLLKTNKPELLERITRVQNLANVISIRQKRALGLGHAVLTGAPVVGAEPFAVLLGDELMVTPEGEATVTGQLCDAYQKTGLSTVAVMEVDESELHKYGVIGYSEHHEGIYKVSTVVEKPEPGTAPSQLALPGRYVFDHQLFAHLKEIKPGRNGELQLTDAMNLLARGPGLCATHFRGTRYDAGDKLGFLIANVEFGACHSEIGPAFRKYLKKFTQTLNSP